MKTFFQWLRSRVWYFALFAAFFAVLGLLFYLYRLSGEIVIYGFALCAALGLIFCAGDFAAFRRRHRALRAALEAMTVASEFKVITAADYNTLLGGNVTLQDGEGLLYTPNYTKNAFSGDSLTLCGRPYRVTMLTSFPLEASVSNFGCETYYLVVRDAGELAALREAQTAGNGGSAPVYIISFNLDGTDEEKIDCSNAVASALSDDQQGGAQATDSRVACRAQQYQEFVSVYGGLFFLGLFLGFLFLMTTISAPSVSIEGKNLWIAQSLPVPAAEILKAKLTLHISILLPAMPSTAMISCSSLYFCSTPCTARAVS